MARRRKYGNKPTVADGIKFASKAEASRYRDLKLLERAGEISDLETHPRFLLQEGFDHPSCGHQRPMYYTADFAYTEDGARVVEDVKSEATAKSQSYKMRVKLLLYRYRDIDFREVIF